jgi:hypothetical protein
MHSLVTAAVSAISVKDVPPPPAWSWWADALRWLSWTVTLAATAGVVWQAARLMYIFHSGILDEDQGRAGRVVTLAVIASAGAIISRALT